MTSPPRSVMQLSLDEPKVVRQERTLNKSSVKERLQSAVQKIQDSKVTAVSDPTRFEAAYDAILFAGLALFAAQGFRISSQPGHHRVALEGLVATLGLSSSIHDELEMVLEERNSKYTGFLTVKPADLALVLSRADDILTKTSHWFETKHPELLK